MPAITVSTINATIGVDDSKLTQGLAAAKGNVTRFGSEVTATSSVVSEMMKSAGAAVGTSVSAGSKLASDSLKVLADRFKEVNHSAQEFGEAIKEAAEKAGEHVKKLGEDVKKVGKEVSEALDIVILAVGEAVLESGLQVEEGMDAIGRATGKTGEELEGMKGTFKETFGEVSQGAAVVGQTMGLLSSRTGLTGHALAQLTKQMLDLARMQGTDVVATSVAMTREMGDASIAAKDQGQAMDYLFRVSQLTGTTAQSLAEKMTFYGAPLRQMGIGFEQAALLMGKWEKEGVNTELVMGSMRIGLMRLAESGIKEPAKALPLLIEKMKDAKTTGEATAIAMHVFGARAGADMAAAVREGRFNLDELTKAMKGTKGGIEATSEATKPLSERFEEFKHKVMDLLEPIGTQLIGSVTKLYEKFAGPLLGAIKSAVDWWTRLKPTTQAFAVALVVVAAAIGPVTFAIGAMIIAISAILPVAGAVLAFFIGPWGIAFAGAAVAIYKMVFEGAHSLGQLKNNVMEFWAWFKPGWVSFWDGALGIIKAAWGFINDEVGGAIQTVYHVVMAVIDLFTGDWKGAWDEVKLAVSATWDSIVDIFTNVGPRLLAAIKSIWASIKDAFSADGADSSKALANQVHKDATDGVTSGLDKAAKDNKIKDSVNKFTAALRAKIGVGSGTLAPKDLGKLDKLEDTGKHGGSGDKPKKLSEHDKEFKELQTQEASLLAQSQALEGGTEAAFGKLRAHYHLLSKETVTGLIDMEHHLEIAKDKAKETTAVMNAAAELRGKILDLKFGKEDGGALLAKNPMASQIAVEGYKRDLQTFTELQHAKENARRADEAYDATVKKERGSVTDLQAEWMKLTHTSLADQLALKETGLLYDQLDVKRKKLIDDAVVWSNLIEKQKKDDLIKTEDIKNTELLTKNIAGLKLAMAQKTESPEAATKRAVSPFTNLTNDQQAEEEQDLAVKMLGKDYTALDPTIQALIEAYLIWQHRVEGKTAADVAAAEASKKTKEITDELTKKLAETNAQLDHVTNGAQKHSQWITDFMVQHRDLTKEQVDLLNQLITAEDKLTRQNRQVTQVKSLMDTMRNSFDQMFMGIITGSKNAFDQLVTGFETMLQQMAAKYLANQLINGFFQMLGFNPDGTSTGGGLFGGSGGESGITDMSQIVGKASGGPVNGGQTYLVGENGPELFKAPQGGGSIVPNNQLGGGGVTVHLNVQAQDVHSFRQYSHGQAAADLAQAMQIAQRRNG